MDNQWMWQALIEPKQHMKNLTKIQIAEKWQLLTNLVKN